MKRLNNPSEAREFVWDMRRQGRTVGLVPTMGALHDGHLSLVQLAKEHCHDAVATIFVNPTQFAPGEDLDKYPRTLEADCEKLRQAGASAVFVPASDSMYPEGFSTYVDPPEVAKSLEGVCRPGFFRGVTTIVMKLFQCLPATHAFFGKKDYQQLKVIEAMVRDLDVGIQIVAGETVRESDGLALSSRNVYLSDEERTRALLLSAALSTAKSMVKQGVSSAAEVQVAMRQKLLGESAPGVDKIDYAQVVDANTLAAMDQINRPAVALIAAYVGNTRLIDNCELVP